MELTQIGFAVRTARQAARMSATELASAVALTPAALSKIETGRQNLDFKTAISIAHALKISLDHLAVLAEKVSDASMESGNVRREFASRLKSLEQSAIKTALSVMHEPSPDADRSAQ
ncbi:helix-turn-helix domain-containing protein [Herbaspirillum sp. GCM10030257]|uniref:helix-turn-helix domain-containing protein n=1 Tax=Herbaspirillum sp. GCM10030257 TaxID=3273393 RepID=UPI00361A9118